jgi:serine/threonine protein kinase
MKEFRGLTIDIDKTGMSPLAKNLVESLCSLKPGHRYTIDQALMHPWITGNLNDEIPMTDVHKFTKAIVNFHLENRMRRMFNFVTFLSITKNFDAVESNHRKVSGDLSTNVDSLQPNIGISPLLPLCAVRQ